MSSALRVKRRHSVVEVARPVGRRTRTAGSACVGRAAGKRQETELDSVVRPSGRRTPRSRSSNRETSAALVDDVLEEVLRRVVGRDAGRDDARRLARRSDRVAHQLGEDRVGVDVAAPAERVAAARRGRGGSRPPPRAWRPRTRRAGPRSSSASALISRSRAALFGAVGDLGRPGGEELLLLELDALPRRVAEHDIEPAALPDRGERDVPVQERVRLSRLPHDRQLGVGQRRARQRRARGPACPG